MQAHTLRGQTNYHAGLAAEDSVVRDYTRRGHSELARRWRGRGGEIDLIFREGARIVFVEVKKARSFAEAAERIGPRQIERLFAAATEFLGGQPDGLLTDIRFDVALVDASGAVEIRENAFA